jgi:zinc protease
MKELMMSHSRFLKSVLMHGLIALMLYTGTAHADASKFAASTPLVPAPLADSVDRVLASRPGDLFVVLKNGLTVLMRRKTENDVVSAQVFVRAGSIYEGRHLTAGLSHYLEHVVSGGSTRSFTEAEAKERLQKMGGATNAYTSHDRTVYYINTSATHWKDALDLLLSYVSENALNPQEVAREKAVIQQEIKMGENNVDRQLWNLFIRTAYLRHPVRNPVIGYEQVFIQTTPEDLAGYYTERYRPDQMIVAVVGNLEPWEALSFVAEKTKDFSRKSAPPLVLPDEPSQMGPRWAEQESELARLQQALLGFPSVSLHNPDMYPLDVLAFLLGEGQTSRLDQRLKERESLVLGVGASNWTPGFVHGQFTISLTLPPENWPGVLAGVEQEIERFKTELVHPQELEKAKKTTIARHIFAKETVSAAASSLASSFFDTGDPYFDEAYVEAIRNVTAEQIREVARTYLRKERMSVAVLKPPGSPVPAAAAQKLDEPLADRAGEAFHTLSNGLKVILKEDSSLPVVHIQLYGIGGLLLEPASHPGLSAFTASLLTAGTSSRSKMEILSTIEDIGGSIASRSDSNTYHISLRVLREDLETALSVLADVVQHANFPEDEIEKKRKEILLSIHKQEESWQYELMELFKRSYFSKSPYERDRLGTSESIQAIGREEIIAFFERMVNPSHSVLAVYGDIESRSLLAKLDERLGSWKGKAVALPDWPNETQPLTTSRTVEKKTEKTSASLFVGTNGLDIGSERRPALDVLDAVLAGASYPGGRLFEALRGGQEDLVYIVGATTFYGKKAGYFGVITQTTLGNLDKVQNVILGHLKRIQDEPIPSSELETARDMILTMHHLDRESLSSQAVNAAVDEVLGMGWDYEKRYPELIRKVTAEEVQQLARELFANTLVVRAIPEKPVEALPRKTASRHSSIP